jgi:hypothetical protein
MTFEALILPLIGGDFFLFVAMRKILEKEQ